jgi:hypothetical protein
VALLPSSVPHKERSPEWRMANGAVQAGAKDAWWNYMNGELRAAHGGTVPTPRSVEDHLAEVVAKHRLIDNG